MSKTFFHSFRYDTNCCQSDCHAALEGLIRDDGLQKGLLKNLNEKMICWIKYIIDTHLLIKYCFITIEL